MSKNKCLAKNYEHFLKSRKSLIEFPEKKNFIDDFPKSTYRENTFIKKRVKTLPNVIFSLNYFS